VILETFLEENILVFCSTREFYLYTKIITVEGCISSIDQKEQSF